MSQYVDSEYYLNTFKGATIPADDLNKYLLIASEKVNELTFNRIVKIGFNNLTDFQKEKVQRAVCLHADYMYQGGTEMGQISSYSVLDINVTVDNKNSTEAKYGVKRDTYDLLKQTGLMCLVN